MHDLLRSYDRLCAQITWLLGERGVDESTLARSVIGAMRGEPIVTPFATTAQRNVVARLAWLWLWRAPWLSPSALLTAPIELDALARGEGTMAAAVRSVLKLELAPSEDARTLRARSVLRDEAGSIEDLWSREEATLAPCIASLRERLGSADGLALLDELAATISMAFEATAGGPLATADAYVDRARDGAGGAFRGLFPSRVPFEALAAPLADAEAALALEPDHVGALLLRANLRILSGADRDQARADALRATERAPESGYAQLVVGHVLRASGDVDGAIDRYTRAVSAKVPEPAGYVFRGVLRVDAGDLDAAERDAALAIAALPRADGSHALLGRVRALRGDRSGALESFAVALALEPSNAGVHCWRADVWSAAGDTRRALEDLDRAVLLSNSADVLYNRGAFKLTIQDTSGAVADFDAVLERTPDDVQALLNRGTAKAMRQDSEGTLADFRRAAAIAPGHAQARMKYGLVLCDVGLRAEGRVELEAAIACAPHDWAHRGEIERVLRNLRA